MKGLRLVFVSSSLLVIIFAIFIFQTKSFAPITPNAKTSDVVLQKNIAYGKHPKQKLDLCKPKNLEGQAPGVILIHGGGGDKSQHLAECKALAQNGLVAIAVIFGKSHTLHIKQYWQIIKKPLAGLRQETILIQRESGQWAGAWEAM